MIETKTPSGRTVESIQQEITLEQMKLQLDPPLPFEKQIEIVKVIQKLLIERGEAGYGGE